MFRNRILSLLLVLCLGCMALCACASAEFHGLAGVSVSAAAEGMPGLKAASNGKSRVKSIKLSEKKLLLAPGFSARITATVAPDTAEVKEVTWTSSKPEVATVDQNGTVTAVKKGNAKITATATDGSKKKASLTVQVKEYDVVLRTSDEKAEVSFDTVERLDGSKLDTGKYVIGEYNETKVKFEKGCVRSEENGILIPVKTGEDTITVTVKHNGKNLVSRDRYTVLVLEAAEEEPEQESTEPESTEQESTEQESTEDQA